jgi:glyoxylate reductase
LSRNARLVKPDATPVSGPHVEGRAAMPSKKPLVIVTRKLPDVIETRMRELFDARLNLDDVPMTQEQLVDAMRVCEVLVPTVTDRLDARLLARAGAQLKLIANYGNGVDKHRGV